MPLFHTASDDDIRDGKVSDVYFTRVVHALEHAGADPLVAMEVRAGAFPERWPWAVFAGLEEALTLLRGRQLDVFAMPEGSIFGPEDTVLLLTGRYLEFAVHETALLGMLCQASGIATKAARCKLAAGERQVISFGARRMHPGITPMIERNAFIGGCDGVASMRSAELIHEEPMGTMAHALVLALGDERAAYLAFDAAAEPNVKRVALIDTFQDEKFGALTAAEVLGDKLAGVRLDTPSSRRGDFLKIMREVRWELDARGFNQVGIFLSGGLNERDILRYNEYANAYGVGTSISNAPVVDYSMDIVEVGGEPRAKRGKMSGRKQVYRCDLCHRSALTHWEDPPVPCACGGTPRAMLRRYLAAGELTETLPSPQGIRAHVLAQLEGYELEELAPLR
ncbi:MAG: nicotinate phosphoribosyltransferase [Candidatus Geothermincolia bacterium]